MPGILVVEDDENLNRGITFSLKKSGYEVFSAESVKKAKRIASDNNVDVTICDVNLPDGNGLEFCSLFCRRTLQMELLAVSYTHLDVYKRQVVLSCNGNFDYSESYRNGISKSWR